MAGMGEDEKFVVASLAGELGEPHRAAAEAAMTAAQEHGFIDDPRRVADAVRVCLGEEG